MEKDPTKYSPIRILRKERGLSCKQLSKITGIHYESIRSSELHNFNVSIQLLRRLAHGLHFPAADFIAIHVQWLEDTNQ